MLLRACEAISFLIKATQGRVRWSWSRPGLGLGLGLEGHGLIVVIALKARNYLGLNPQAFWKA